MNWLLHAIHSIVVTLRATAAPIADPVVDLSATRGVRARMPRVLSRVKGLCAVHDVRLTVGVVALLLANIILLDVLTDVLTTVTTIADSARLLATHVPRRRFRREVLANVAGLARVRRAQVLQ